MEGVAAGIRIWAPQSPGGGDARSSPYFSEKVKRAFYHSEGAKWAICCCLSCAAFHVFI
jgi:hypothetical protein